MVSASLHSAPVLYIFTVIGVDLLAKVGYNNSYDIHVNFRTFGLGMLALTRFFTGDVELYSLCSYTLMIFLLNCR